MIQNVYPLSHPLLCKSSDFAGSENYTRFNLLRELLSIKTSVLCAIYFRNYASDIICGYHIWPIINSAEISFPHDGKKKILKPWACVNCKGSLIGKVTVKVIMPSGTHLCKWKEMLLLGVPESNTNQTS